MILVFWMLSFKPTFSLSSFTFTKRLFNSSSLSAIRVVSSAKLRWLLARRKISKQKVKEYSFQLYPLQTFYWWHRCRNKGHVYKRKRKLTKTCVCVCVYVNRKGEKKEGGIRGRQIEKRHLYILIIYMYIYIHIYVCVYTICPLISRLQMHSHQSSLSHSTNTLTIFLIPLLWLPNLEKCKIENWTVKEWGKN